MQRARTTESDREASLRRVAIVLSSLPAPVASKLLGSMDAGSKQLLRRTMATLSDVDPLERQRALVAFKTSFRSPPDQPTPQPSHQPAANGEDEMAIGNRGAHPNPHRGSRVVSGVAEQITTAPDVLTQANSSTADSSPLSFLGDIDDDTLADLLRGEHPQTVALVLASIAPAVAARVIPRLETTLQSDALGRIGRLGEIPDDVVRDLAIHLRERIMRLDSQHKTQAGKRALGAILAAMPATTTENAAPSPTPREIPATVADPIPDPEPEIAPTRSHRAPDDPSETRPPEADIEPIGFAKSDLSAVDQTHRLRLVTQVEAETTAIEPIDQSPAEQDFGADESAEMFGSTDAIHQYLMQMPPADLCAALGKVSTRHAILTLCGLPNDVADAVLAELPRAQSKQVRRGMSSIQSLELREIDEAKESVARNSIDDESATDEGSETTAERSVRLAA